MGPSKARVKPRPPRKVALVTGGGHRVGLAIANELKHRGWRVAAHYLSHLPPRGLVGFKADLATGSGADDLAEAFLARFDRLDLLVCSAAGFFASPLSQTDAAGFDELMDLNARAPLLLARALAPTLARSQGSIVNVADIGGGLVPWKGYAAYSASKAALVRITECLALELAPGVRVNAVAPGTVLWPRAYPARVRRNLTRRIPLGRVGTPLDVAQAVRYLAEATFVTGVVLPVDGGRRLSGRIA
ncbi:MAG TPA: SDR family oxidoreductase [Anaeromyxobacteraceae bacterium]|nr:SDR family oxidoreductase [Anaeromyxobacteraceae bacterium]